MKECEHVNCGVLCDQQMLMDREPVRFNAEGKVRKPKLNLFGPELRERVQALKATGMSQHDVARELGISQTSCYRRWHDTSREADRRAV